MPNMQIKYRKFPTGDDLISPSTLTLADGTPMTVPAPGILGTPDPANPGATLTYAFLFWNVKGSLTKSSTMSLLDVGEDPFTASAWYYPMGGGSGPTGVSVYSFSITQDLTGANPIETVNPAAAWSSGSNWVATGSAAVTINAKDSMGSEPFESWLSFGSETASGQNLNVPQKQGWLALATYQAKTFSVPKPGPYEIQEPLFKLLKKLKRYVGDPAPIDLAQWIVRYSTQAAQAAAQDDLSQVLTNAEAMTRDQLQLLRTDLQSRHIRMDAAMKALDAELKRR